MSLKIGVGSNITFGTGAINSGIEAIYSGTESAPLSGSVFAFGEGGYLSVTEDGMNLVYTNVSGDVAQITSFE